MQRTWELNTVWGAAKATALTAAALLSAVAGLILITDSAAWTGYALFGVGAVGLLFVVGPVWFFTMLELMADARRQHAEVSVLTPAIRAAELRIQEYQERAELLRTLEDMDDARVQFALSTLAADIFRIDNARVTWFVERVGIPPAFAPLWVEKYHERGGDQLPADHDFNYLGEGEWSEDGIFSRDNARTWNSAIIEALVKAGVARPAAGPLPPRWTITDPTRRAQELARTGLYIAASWADLLEQERAKGRA